MIAEIAAVWRVTRLVTEDEIAAPLRGAFPVGSKAEYLVNCPYCVSVWAGAAVASGLVPRRVVSALALSAGAVLINEALGAVRAAQFQATLRSVE